MLILCVGLMSGESFSLGLQALLELAGCLCGGAIAGLLCRGYQLRDQSYFLKDNHVPGFVGSLTLDSTCLSGFHRTLADALLYFSGYSGIGIKTTLGMGGIGHLFGGG